MKAIRVTGHGGPEVLKLENVELLTPGPGQAVVKIAAAGLNFIDIYERRGTYPVKLPYVPGREAAGLVEAVGVGVENVKPGDRVAYTSQLGAYAEASVVRAEKLIPLPSFMSFEEGAAFPLQGLTAQYLLHEFYQPKPGDWVLIHAAAGGMGLLLVQWAKHLGAQVIGTVSTPEKSKIAREAGADEVINYLEKDFVAEVMRITGNEGARLIIDGVGKSTFPGDLEAAALLGHVVIFGAASGPADHIAPNSLQTKSLTVSGGALWNYTRTRDELMRRADAVLEGFKRGWLRLRIDHKVPLENAPEAHRLLESRKSTGKIVLTTGTIV